MDKRGEAGVKVARLSGRHFRSNETRHGLGLIAYNLCRRLVLPQRIGNCSLTSLQHP